MRRYSLREIDQLRTDLAWLRQHPDPTLKPFERPTPPKDIEEELRTLMAAGVALGDVSKTRKEREETRRLATEWNDAEKAQKQADCPHPAWSMKHAPFCYSYPSGSCCCHNPVSCDCCGLYDRRWGKKQRSHRPGGRRKSDKPKNPVTVKAAMEASLNELREAAATPVVVQYGKPGIGKTLLWWRR